MDDRRFDRELDDLLTEGLTAPSEDILYHITPWRRATNRILIGLALRTFTLNFCSLDYILPAVGFLLILLGLRVLRRENGFFRLWWCAFLVQGMLYAFQLLHWAAPGWQEFDQTPLGRALIWAGLALTFLQFFCLWQGLRGIRRKAGLLPGAGSGLALLVFHCLILYLGLSGLTQLGWFFFALMLIAYICIIRGLYKLSKELDEAGYAIQPAPVRIPDRLLALGLAGAVLTGIAAVSLTCSRLPMDWQPVDPSERSGLAEAENHLLELGFPEEVLADLLPEDILACDGALRVVVEESRHSLTMAWDENTPKPLTMTHVAVELGGEQKQWRMFHHFSWESGTNFYANEAFQLWTLYDYTSGGWSKSGELTGRVLYDRGGITYTSPYHSLSAVTHTTAGNLFWGPHTSSDPFAAFSLPRNGENCRGYAAYGAAEVEDNWIINSWINYVHCRRMFVYPTVTALEWQMAGTWNGSKQPFIQVQDSIQFYP